jgi:hypothetical protein
LLERGFPWRRLPWQAAQRWRVAHVAPGRQARAVCLAETVPYLVTRTRRRVGRRRRSIDVRHEDHSAASTARSDRTGGAPNVTLAAGAHRARSTRVGLAACTRIRHAEIVVPGAPGSDTATAEQDGYAGRKDPRIAHQKCTEDITARQPPAVPSMIAAFSSATLANGMRDRLRSRCRVGLRSSVTPGIVRLRQKCETPTRLGSQSLGGWAKGVSRLRSMALATP